MKTSQPNGKIRKIILTKYDKTLSFSTDYEHVHLCEILNEKSRCNQNFIEDMLLKAIAAQKMIISQVLKTFAVTKLLKLNHDNYQVKTENKA